MNTNPDPTTPLDQRGHLARCAALVLASVLQVTSVVQMAASESRDATAHTPASAPHPDTPARALPWTSPSSARGGRQQGITL